MRLEHDVKHELDEQSGRRLDDDRLALSRLMDGDASELDAGCLAFARDAGARADWHAYHVLGDVLRSEELAAGATSDAEFLARLRGRLASEPAILAPAAPRRPRRAWMASAAVAAGFFAVAAALVVTREASLGDGAQADRLAGAEGAAPALASAVAASGVDAVLIRDAQLDRYLAAHRDYAALGALAAPGAGLRKAAASGGPDR